MKRAPSAQALSCSLALVLSTLSACSRDPGIAIPEANRHSLDTEGSVEAGTPYDSVDEGEDSIAGEIIETEVPPAEIAVDAPEPPPAPEDETESGASPEFPEDPANDGETTPVAEAPPVTSPKPLPVTKGPIEDGRYIIEGVQSKKCIDVPGGGAAIGLQMQIWACNSSNPNQFLTVEWVSDWKAYRFRTSTGKQLSISPEKTNASRPLVLAEPLDAAHTLFAIDKSGPGSTYQIRALEQLLVFDVVNRELLDGKLIQVFSPFTPAEGHQQWVFIKVKP